MARAYELRKRADRMADTHRRIVEAAVELHTSIGPGRTSISAIAERAGVERHTVYAHFPDRLSLFRACSDHWRELHPFPAVDQLASIEDPRTRLRTGLDALYAWYEQVEDDLALIRRDADTVPAEVRATEAQRFGSFRAVLETGWPRRHAVRAAIGHALQFETWRSLSRREGLSRRAAVEAMLRLAAGG